MINKKNLLGKKPQQLGDKDAVHVAIVAVRAGVALKPGQRCVLNAAREAIPDENGIGVADPWRKSNMARGEELWLVLNQEEVANVRHTWEHAVDFSAPAGPVKLNTYLKEIADKLHVSYASLMDACGVVVATDSAVPYPGDLSDDELEEVFDEECWDLWSEWAEETGHEFENYGSECCPEYEYPSKEIFVKS